MKILVLGGSGFLGSHTADKLSQAGHEVTVFDRAPSPWLRPDQKMIVGDLLDDATLGRAVAGAEAVYNFAGLADLAEANEKPVESAAVNVLGAVKALEAARRAEVRRFVFASSLYVYGRRGGFYRLSKKAAELYVEGYREAYGLEYVILRYGSLYGPRAGPTNGIYKFIREAMETGRLVFSGAPDTAREYIHVEDAAQCGVDILGAAFANQSVILSGWQTLRMADLFKMIGEILGRPLDCSYVQDPYGIRYDFTPYAFEPPKIAKKMVPACQVDLGTGLLSVMEEIAREARAADGF